MSNGDSSRDLFGMVKTWPLKKGCLWPPTFGDEKVTAAESPGSGAFLIMHSFCGHFAPSKPKLNPTNLEILDSPLIGKVLKTPKKNIQPSCDAYRLEVWWKNKTSWEKKLMIITCTSAPSRSRYPIFQLYICIYIYDVISLWLDFFSSYDFFPGKNPSAWILYPEFLPFSSQTNPASSMSKVISAPTTMSSDPPLVKLETWTKTSPPGTRPGVAWYPKQPLCLWMEMVKQPSFYVMIWNHPVEATIKNWLFGVPGGSICVLFV